MSPHGLVLLSALLLAAIAKLAFPHWTLRIAAAVALGLPLAVILLLREPPSLLGILIVAPIAAAGAALGIIAGKLTGRLWLGFRRPR